jgi:D-alanyl-D-alanine carboxypeptidase
MRPDIGLATLPQRLSGLRQMTPTAPPAAPGGSFADALAHEVGAAAAGAGAAAGAAGSTAYASGPTGSVPGLPGLLGQGAPGQVAQLGAGVRVRGGGLIAPQLPGVGGVGVGGVGVAGAAGVHSCPECQPLAGVAGGLAGGAAGGVAAPRTGPPAELQAYGNGRIPVAALEPLGVGDHRLWAPAARAFRDLAAAAARDGVHIGVNSSYRDLAGQQAMVDRYGLYSQGGRAAAPGSSNHGWGVSLDLQLDDRAQAWMRANAASYGFAEDVPREPWHWTFTASGY